MNKYELGKDIQEIKERLRKLEECVCQAGVVQPSGPSPTPMPAPTPSPAPTEVTLSSATATFNTTTNDKDHDTLLDVRVYGPAMMIVAQLTGIAGHWNDHSTNTVVLTLQNAAKKSDLQSGMVRLDIHPNGNDKWEFGYMLALTFSDGSTLQKAFDGKVLTQDNPTLMDSW